MKWPSFSVCVWSKFKKGTARKDSSRDTQCPPLQPTHPSLSLPPSPRKSPKKTRTKSVSVATAPREGPPTLDYPRSPLREEVERRPLVQGGPQRPRPSSGVFENSWVHPRAPRTWRSSLSLPFIYEVPDMPSLPFEDHLPPLPRIGEGRGFAPPYSRLGGPWLNQKQYDYLGVGLRSNRISFIPNDVKGLTKIVLKKDTNDTLGLIISGGVDLGHRPRVSKLRPGSPASESDLLTVGDYIVSVNGAPTAGLAHEGVVGLLRAAGDSVELEVEYEMPKLPSSSGNSVIEKTVSIILQKENGTFGFTLRGGMSPDGGSRPLLVTHVRPGGPADREGSLKAGDRLVALDGKDLTRLSLCEAQVALQEVENSATLAIRFDISVMDPVRCGGGPLLVEIERSPGSSLGLSLNASRSAYGLCNNSLPKTNASSCVVIESIRSASIAERCGALAVGDAVCSVDGLRLDQNILKEANQILGAGQGHKVTLEVIPNRNCIRARAGSPVLISPPYIHRFSFYNTLGPSRTLNTTSTRNHRRLREGSPLSPGSPGVLSHAEVVRVTLLAEGMSVGMVLRPAIDGTFPLVAAIDPGGATDKLGVICIGDRILGVNGRSVNGLGVSEVTQMLNNTRPTVIIDFEIDVTDSVVPSSGTFSIKLSKRQCCLGINVARGRRPSPGDPSGEVVLISDITQGSAAHRSGTLQVGDRIMSIDNTRLDSLTLDQTRALLQDPENDVVTIKVQKDDLYSDDTNCITYTVQIHRDKGALGISATGSEEPFDPIIVKGIAPGSLAAQTGAIHIGDRLLSINGVSLRGKPLSEAIRLLQGNEDTVALKISRPKEPGLSSNVVSQDWLGFHGPPAPSVDSAVESWGSGGIDLPSNGAPTLLSGKTDSTPELFRSNCGSTVRRKTQTKSSSSDRGSTSNEERKSWGCSSHSSDSGQSDGTDWEKMIADLNQISATCGLREKSVLHDANGNLMAPSQSNGEIPFSNSMTVNSSEPGKAKPTGDSTAAAVPTSFKFGRRTASPDDVFDEGTYSVSYAAALRHAAPHPTSEEPCPVPPPNIFTLTLAKDPFYEDFGFSVSDGLYEKGVYVNRIRKGGPAFRSGLLKPYDRILQVNETQTEDFDCCLTVPLIAAAEDSLFLKVSRPSNGAPLPSSFRLFNDLRMNAWLQTEDEDEATAAAPNCNRVS